MVLGFPPLLVCPICEFEGVETARPSPGFQTALVDSADNGDGPIVICPSNPFVSVEPMLRLTGVRETLRDSHRPVIAVSPIVGGEALKGLHPLHVAHWNLIGHSELDVTRNAVYLAVGLVGMLLLSPTALAVQAGVKLAEHDGDPCCLVGQVRASAHHWQRSA